jgi:membrane protease YdiL (CAAX protease family)
LAVVLVVRPGLYCFLDWDWLVTFIRSGSRAHWWSFHALLLLFQWIPTGLIWLDIRREPKGWSSLGLEWHRLKRHWWWLVAVVFLLAVGASLARMLSYGDAIPQISGRYVIAGITAPERLFVLLVVCASAGFCEEVAYRGYALTRLGCVLPNVWIALPLTVIAFVFIHGIPRDAWRAGFQALFALVLGAVFIFLRWRRLEFLILLHFLYDARLAFEP